jgi:hypothetical protein
LEHTNPRGRSLQPSLKSWYDGIGKVECVCHSVIACGIGGCSAADKARVSSNRRLVDEVHEKTAICFVRNDADANANLMVSAYHEE